MTKQANQGNYGKRDINKISGGAQSLDVLLAEEALEDMQVEPQTQADKVAALKTEIARLQEISQAKAAYGGSVKLSRRIKELTSALNELNSSKSDQVTDMSYVQRFSFFSDGQRASSISLLVPPNSPLTERASTPSNAI